MCTSSALVVQAKNDWKAKKVTSKKNWVPFPGKLATSILTIQQNEKSEKLGKARKGEKGK